MADDKPLSVREREQVERLFGSPIDFPPQFRSWLEQFQRLTMRGATDSVPSTATGGGGDVATDSIFDAKGDLVVGSGPDAAARLPVGTDTYVLTADSAQTLGLKWAAAAGGGSLLWEDV